MERHYTNLSKMRNTIDLIKKLCIKLENKITYLYFVFLMVLTAPIRPIF